MQQMTPGEQGIASVAALGNDPKITVISGSSAVFNVMTMGIGYLI
jgi:hypothetical protein